jgi:hypothetical protein
MYQAIIKDDSTALAGWFQIVAFCGFTESTDSPMRQKCISQMTAKLNAVLATSRLALMVRSSVRERQQGQFLGAPRCRDRTRPLLAVGVHRLRGAGVPEARRLHVAVHGRQVLRGAVQGLVALSKVPMAGRPQIVAFCGLVEIVGFTFTR